MQADSILVCPSLISRYATNNLFAIRFASGTQFIIIMCRIVFDFLQRNDYYHLFWMISEFCDIMNDLYNFRLVYRRLKSYFNCFVSLLGEKWEMSRDLFVRWAIVLSTQLFYGFFPSWSNWIFEYSAVNLIKSMQIIEHEIWFNGRKSIWYKP